MDAHGIETAYGRRHKFGYRVRSFRVLEGLKRKYSSTLHYDENLPDDMVDYDICLLDGALVGDSEDNCSC